MRACLPKTPISRLDILADILIDSTFDRDELEREKSVILQEIGAIEDTPDDLVFDMFGETAYADQPIGRRIIGTAKRVATFDPPSIHSYLKRHYGAETIIVSAAGAVDHAKIVDEARARFEHLPFAAHPETPPGALYRRRDQAEAALRAGSYRHRLRGRILHR